MLKDIIGKNFEWKVGDIDRILNGNLIVEWSEKNDTIFK
jgi:hypothetical protein